MVWGFLGSLIIPFASADPGRATLMRTPDHGIQPQAAVDDHGTVHMIYFKGEARSGDVFYIRRPEGEESFSEPIRVNTETGSVMAIGTIRGAQMAIGRNGRVHVAWNGRAPKNGDHREAPMLYTRLDDAATAFEPERDVITVARGLDGGGSVAADNEGNVFVMWHAPIPGGVDGEAGRGVFVARSRDDGKTFTPETLATREPTGACGCCGMRGFATGGGNVFALYRGAFEQVHRDEILLVSRNYGADYETAFTHPWEVATCPMSSAFFSATDSGVLAAWETAGQVYFARVTPGFTGLPKPVAPSGRGKRKHPVAVGNDRGEVLLVWTEGTGWGKGGAVVWQFFDAIGKPISKIERTDGVPVWSFATAFAQPDGSFVIVY